MAIVINGSGTITGVSVGGLPDGIVDAGTLATNSVDSAELIDGAVDNSHLADDAVGLAEMASGTDGNIISYDASGNPVAIATGSDGQVLTSTGAGSPPAFEDAAGGNSPYMTIRKTYSNRQTITDYAYSKITFSDAKIESQSGLWDTSNYRFVVPSGEAGKYFATLSLRVDNASTNLINTFVMIYENGSDTNSINYNVGPEDSDASATISNIAGSVSHIYDLSVGDYLEGWTAANTTGNNSDVTGTFTVFKIG
jgi:hypothetical protein